MTDASGNTANCDFTVTVTDAENPVIACPADINQGTDSGSCDAVVTYTAPTGTDNCPNSTTVLGSGLASGATFPLGATVNSYTVTDASGNEASCTFTVTIEDNENPTISCPSDVNVNNDNGVCGATCLLYTSDAADDQ